MRQVSIRVHYVDGTRDDFGVPVEDMQVVYRSSNIDLEVTEGTSIAVDPVNSGLRNFAYWVTTLRQREPQAGHLIVAMTPPDQRFDVAGELLDVDYRSTAAVFTQSEYLLQGRSNYLQTCVHEVGHLLNLAHGDTTGDFSSAMDQADGRQNTSPEESWTLARKEAGHIGNEGFFVPPQRAVPCYPFALPARVILNTWTENRIMPGQGKFERAYDGLNDCKCRFGALSRRGKGYPTTIEGEVAL